MANFNLLQENLSLAVTKPDLYAKKELIKKCYRKTGLISEK
jgi:hypothetical protein